MVLADVHLGVNIPPHCTQCCLVRGRYEYHHYGVDGFTDHGWGCGYRTLQTLASWVIINKHKHRNCTVPCIRKIQVSMRYRPLLSYYQLVLRIWTPEGKGLSP